jgi:hypothetical protein
MQNAPRFDISEWPIVHKDRRRIIREKPLDHGILLTGLEILCDTEPLGNHFHRKKTEIFYLLSGMATWYTQMLTPDQDRIGMRLHRDVMINEPFTVPAYTAHAVKLSPGSTMACINTEPFDKADLITYVLVL